MTKTPLTKPAPITDIIRQISSRIQAGETGAILELINVLWPEIVLFPFQEYIVLKAFQHSELFLEMSRGAGKSWIVGLIAIVKKLIWPGRKIIYSGPTYRQSRHPYHYEIELLQQSPHLRDIVKKTSGERIGKENTERTEVVYRNGSVSVALPASGTKIHGERGSDLVVTEAFDYEKHLLTRTTENMLIGARRWIGMPKSIIYETTAWTQTCYAYEKRMEIIERMLAGDTSACFISITSDDLWDYGYLEPQDKRRIDRLRLIDEDGYLQQHQNRWLTTAGTFYNLVVLTNPDLKPDDLDVEFLAKPGYLHVAGLDVAWSERQDAADSAFAIWRIPLTESGRPDLHQLPELVYVEVWHAPGTERQTKAVGQLLRQFDISLLVIDAQGAGVDVFLGLKKMGYAEVGSGEEGRKILFKYVHTSPIINEDHNSFKAAAINKAVRFASPPDDPSRRDMTAVTDLIALAWRQAADLKTEETATGWLHFEAPSGKKRDIFMAILYGWHAVRMKTEAPEKRRRDLGIGIVGLGEPEW